MYATLFIVALAWGGEAEETPPDASEDEVVETGFYAGSYGRAQATFDLTGGRGDPVNIASRATRHELGSYLELDLGWRFKTRQGAKFDVLITPAFSGDVFHYSGQFDAQLAIRNLYAEARDFIPGVPLFTWAGSRMYRGDDIYLLDFWPMDGLNTLGGGVGWRPGDSEIALHVGTNRLLGGEFQVQNRRVQVPDRVDGQEVQVLDRQRIVSSLRALHHFTFGDLTLRVKAYGEVHALPAGERIVDDPFAATYTQALPNDVGTLAGVQLSLWGWAPQSFLHLWVRHASGLAAFGELTIPEDGLDRAGRTKSAQSWMVALTGNHETQRVGVMGALVAEYKTDADGIAQDHDDRWELMGIVRPQVYLTPHVNLGVELSHQHVRPNGVNPWTGTLQRYNLTKLAVIPAVQLGRGGYSRPRLQVVYQASFLDRGAVQSFAPDDERIDGNVLHFIGIGAEWWVNTQRIITPSRL